MNSSLLVVLHVLFAFLLVSGLIGRALCYALASKAGDLATLRARAEIGLVFDHSFIRPSSGLLLLTGLIAAWIRGWPILGALQGGTSNWVFAALVLYLLNIPMIALIHAPKERAYHRAVAEAAKGGAITPAVLASLGGPQLALGRTFEVLVTVIILWLMVAKPF
jgi:uncharacterized membrane protein